MNEEYYTVAELVTKFKVTKQAVHKWIKEGKIEAIRMGRAVRIPASSVEKFIRESGETPPHHDDTLTKIGRPVLAAASTP